MKPDRAVGKRVAVQQFVKLTKFECDGLYAHLILTKTPRTQERMHATSGNIFLNTHTCAAFLVLSKKIRSSLVVVRRNREIEIIK